MALEKGRVEKEALQSWNRDEFGGEKMEGSANTS